MFSSSRYQLCKQSNENESLSICVDLHTRQFVPTLTNSNSRQSIKRDDLYLRLKGGLLCDEPGLGEPT